MATRKRKTGASNATAAKPKKAVKRAVTSRNKSGTSRAHPRTIRTVHAREKFLKHLAETCNVTEACEVAGIPRQSAYDLRKTDAAFAADWATAEQEAADKLEREAWRRGVEGTDKPISFQGKITDTYKEYSDRMLELLLKAHRPEKFKERTATELTGKDGGAIETRTADMTPEQRQAEIKRLLTENPALIQYPNP